MPRGGGGGEGEVAIGKEEEGEECQSGENGAAFGRGASTPKAPSCPLVLDTPRGSPSRSAISHVGWLVVVGRGGAGGLLALSSFPSVGRGAIADHRIVVRRGMAAAVRKRGSNGVGNACTTFASPIPSEAALWSPAPRTSFFVFLLGLSSASRSGGPPASSALISSSSSPRLFGSSLGEKG